MFLNLLSVLLLLILFSPIFGYAATYQTGDIIFHSSKPTQSLVIQ